MSIDLLGVSFPRDRIDVHLKVYLRFLFAIGRGCSQMRFSKVALQQVFVSVGLSAILVRAYEISFSKMRYVVMCP